MKKNKFYKLPNYGKWALVIFEKIQIVYMFNRHRPLCLLLPINQKTVLNLFIWLQKYGWSRCNKANFYSIVFQWFLMLMDILPKNTVSKMFSFKNSWNKSVFFFRKWRSQTFSKFNFLKFYRTLSSEIKTKKSSKIKYIYIFDIFYQSLFLGNEYWFEKLTLIPHIRQLSLLLNQRSG